MEKTGDLITDLIVPDEELQVVGTETTIEWSEQYSNAERTVCLISTENLASIHVAHKCGYHEFARAQYKEELNILFERKICNLSELIF